MGSGIDRYLTLALDKDQIAGWEAFMDKFTPAGAALYNFSNNDGFVRFQAHQQKLQQPLFGNCRPVGDARRGRKRGEPGPRAMGVRRAKSPEILAPRLIHAGNERVGPIGVPVASIDDFNKMSDQQLLGPEPAGGAAEQVR